MKKAVVLGAGKIGRGFLGQKAHESGYRITFVDAAEPLVHDLSRAGAYHVYMVSEAGEETHTVDGYEILSTADGRAADRIAQADLVATAVGVRNLEAAAPVLAAGVRCRIRRGGGPLTVLIAENQMHAGELVRSLVERFLEPPEQQWAEANLGFAACSIERMVPEADAEHRRRDPLGIVCEPYARLPIDGDAVRGAAPALTGLTLCRPFSFAEKRKLFMHNMSHALIAYLAHERGTPYIWQAAAQSDIRQTASEALAAVAAALQAEYGAGQEDLAAYAADLLKRFANRRLGDTTARVGADPLRKLRAEDRLTGAALYVLAAGGDPGPLVRGIAAALTFDLPGDPSSAVLREELAKNGLDHVLAERLGLCADHPLADRIRSLL